MRKRLIRPLTGQVDQAPTLEKRTMEEDASLALSTEENDLPGEPEAQVDTEAEAEVSIEAEAEPSDSSPENAEGVSKNHQKRIDKLTWEAREAQRQAEYWREKAEKPEVSAPQAVKTLADFEYDEGQYNAYISEFTTQAAVEAAKRELAKDRAEAARREREFAVERKEQQYAEEFSDYYEVTRNQSVNINNDMVEITAGMEDGPAVRYHLAKNPEVANHIFYMSPLEAARELGRIEAKLQLERSKQGKKVSDAPEPAPGIKAGAPAMEKTWDDMEQNEFNRKRREYINKHRRR